MCGCTSCLWFRISRSTYFVTCTRQGSGGTRGWARCLPPPIHGACPAEGGPWVALPPSQVLLPSTRAAPGPPSTGPPAPGSSQLTFSPRSMNLMATCLPVFLSRASCTKPNVPLFRSLICGKPGTWARRRVGWFAGRVRAPSIGRGGQTLRVAPFGTAGAPPAPPRVFPASCTL